MWDGSRERRTELPTLQEAGHTGPCPLKTLYQVQMIQLGAFLVAFSKSLEFTQLQSVNITLGKKIKTLILVLVLALVLIVIL